MKVRDILEITQSRVVLNCTGVEGTEGYVWHNGFLGVYYPEPLQEMDVVSISPRKIYTGPWDRLVLNINVSHTHSELFQELIDTKQLVPAERLFNSGTRFKYSG